MAAGPPVVRRRESRRISKYQGKRFSEILLEKPRAPFGQIPKSLWTNSGLPLEKCQNAFGKIPNSRWKNSRFQNPPDVPRRGPIPPLKTDFGKIPNSPWKNSGICLEKSGHPPKKSGRSARRCRLTRAPCRARAGSARASLCAHEQYTKDCHDGRAPRAATRELPWSGTDSSSGSPTALRRAKKSSRTSREQPARRDTLGDSPLERARTNKKTWKSRKASISILRAPLKPADLAACRLACLPTCGLAHLLTCRPTDLPTC